jgi:hypothetical protein
MAITPLNRLLLLITEAWINYTSLCDSPQFIVGRIYHFVIPVCGRSLIACDARLRPHSSRSEKIAAGALGRSAAKNFDFYCERSLPPELALNN